MSGLWSRIPRYIQYIIIQTLYLFGFLVFWRVVFYCFFFTSSIRDTPVILKAWGIGLKFDLRLALILMIPVSLVAVAARDRLFGSTALRRINYAYFFLVYLVLVFLYVIDLGYYSHLGIRIEPSVTRFLAAGERAANARVLWESYPVVRGLLGITLLLVFVNRSCRTIFHRFAGKEGVFLRPKSYAAWILALVLFFSAGIYGNFAHSPLQRSQATFAGDNGITSLALNPVTYFISGFSAMDDTSGKGHNAPALLRWQQYLCRIGREMRGKRAVITAGPDKLTPGFYETPDI